ncbi:molybdopterin-dependent oxidoreductase [Nocardia crassostreae]|uniref:molybdopterin-dependent oxidoreductase n=1 Tax=Nocardia crassostreae TaxID=53428 RepID=UPI000833439B|nr:molybdopterin-dependent oxidoreductase [Nocardia crassostreae]
MNSPVRQSSRSSSSVRAVVAGGLAAATVLGVGHLVAVFVDPAASPFYVLGATMVDNTPHTLKDFAIRQFGSKDKQVLFASMAVVMAIGAALIGVLERRRSPLGSALLLGLGMLTAVAALSRPIADWWFAAPALVGTLAGIAVLRLLITGGNRRGAPVAEEPSRRRFLTLAAGAGALALGAATAGRLLAERLRNIAADRARFLLPAPVSPAPAVAPGFSLPVDGITSFVTSNERFYRVDTALQLPTVTSADWRLRVHGMVDRTVEFDMDRLRSRAAVERLVTIACVSNEVGGELAGNARWLGYPLRDLLAEAGPHSDADMLLSRSADGFTAGAPLSAVFDGRDALLAIGMNGAPLPLDHGYPARLIVPGLYGYVSATKWVVDLEITRFDRATAYWTERGWADRAPIETASRIDVPAAFATIAAGPVTVAGVAWAQRRGIAAVEVRVDEQPWQPATLAAEYSIDAWRQWTFRWNATPGTHTLTVRSMDGTGQLQTDVRTPPFPDGSTGWHTRVVTVR